MATEPALPHEYQGWLTELKNRFRRMQIKAAVAVNSELLHFYWQRGAEIVERQSRRTNPCRAGMLAHHIDRRQTPIGQQLVAQFRAIHNHIANPCRASMPTLRFSLLPRAWCGKWSGIVALEQELKEMGNGE